MAEPRRKPILAALCASALASSGTSLRCQPQGTSLTFGRLFSGFSAAVLNHRRFNSNFSN
jgi:hypothetical protein